MSAPALRSFASIVPRRTVKNVAAVATAHLGGAQPNPVSATDGSGNAVVVNSRITWTWFQSSGTAAISFSLRWNGRAYGCSVPSGDGES